MPKPPLTPEEQQAYWRKRGWEQPLLPLDGVQNDVVVNPRRVHHGVPRDVASRRMWTIRMPEQNLAPNLWRTSSSVTHLVRTNDRLMVCFAVAAGIMSEGQACAHLGLDRRTFREILAAAEAWAEEAERNLKMRKEGDEQATPGQPAPGSGGQSPSTGVAGTSRGVGEDGGVPPPGGAAA